MTSETVIPTCYRHPDRETRLACSNCDRPVCVDCVRNAAVGQRCLECAAPSERQRVLDMDDVRRRSDRTPVTMTILVVAVGIYLAEMVLGGGFSDFVRLYGSQINVLVDQGQWWRLITGAFLHARPGETLGISHIAFNMYALYQFGPPLERQFGSLPFAMLYFASAVAGGALFFLLEPFSAAAGASGAIFGLFGAWLAAAYRGRHTTAGRASLNQLLFLLGINTLLGFMPGLNIAWQAHLGGLIAGFLIAAVWAAQPLRGSKVRRAGAAAAVGGLAFLLLLL